MKKQSFLNKIKCTEFNSMVINNIFAMIGVKSLIEILLGSLYQRTLVLLRKLKM